VRQAVALAGKDHERNIGQLCLHRHLPSNKPLGLFGSTVAGVAHTAVVGVEWRGATSGTLRWMPPF
jgi:hypothetical protein